eukprot:1657284-Rhodomonas_salina.4
MSTICNIPLWYKRIRFVPKTASTRIVKATMLAGLSRPTLGTDTGSGQSDGYARQRNPARASSG